MICTMTALRERLETGATVQKMGLWKGGGFILVTLDNKEGVSYATLNAVVHRGEVRPLLIDIAGNPCEWGLAPARRSA